MLPLSFTSNEFSSYSKNQSWVVFKVFDIKAKKEIAFDDLNKVHLFKIFHIRILRLLVKATNILIQYELFLAT